ncbi:MAG: hypothetical protein C0597_00190 [Marinilabiliales bacterium]|nr:MAG: hypothetical protein C0597_00190 [Marinilabiliales bacterium]
MNKISALFLLLVMSIFVSNCDRPDVLDQEGKLKIENTSTSNYITGVYYSTVGYGSNRISTNIGPGESKTFTFDIKDDDIYDIKITSDMTGYEEFTYDHYDFGWNETYIIELTEDGWYTDSTW